MPTTLIIAIPLGFSDLPTALLLLGGTQNQTSLQVLIKCHARNQSAWPSPLFQVCSVVVREMSVSHLLAAAAAIVISVQLRRRQRRQQRRRRRSMSSRHQKMALFGKKRLKIGIFRAMAKGLPVAPRPHNHGLAIRNSRYIGSYRSQLLLLTYNPERHDGGDVGGGGGGVASGRQKSLDRPWKSGGKLSHFHFPPECFLFSPFCYQILRRQRYKLTAAAERIPRSLACLQKKDSYQGEKKRKRRAIYKQKRRAALTPRRTQGCRAAIR